jgi:hypothetical protein
MSIHRKTTIDKANNGPLSVVTSPDGRVVSMFGMKGQSLDSFMSLIADSLGVSVAVAHRSLSELLTMYSASPDGFRGLGIGDAQGFQAMLRAMSQNRSVN